MSQINVVAPAASNYTAGQQPIVNGGRQGDQWVSMFHGDGYSLANSNMLFYSFCVGQAMTAVGTGMVGHILWNGSAAINVCIRKVSVQVSVTSATVTSVVLAASTAANQPSVPTGLTVATRTGSTKLFAATPLCAAYAAATVAVAPSAIWPLLHNTAAIASTGEDPGAFVDFHGSIIVPPFSILCLATVGATAAAAAVTSAITWEEVPV